MKNTKTSYLVLSLLLALTVGARAADPAPEAARLQGTWQAVAAERGGAPAPDVVGRKARARENAR